MELGSSVYIQTVYKFRNRTEQHLMLVYALYHV